MSKHQPALLGGLLIGVLSTLPVVSSFNLCCCLWVVCGGLLVVYLQQQNTPEPVETADAVLGGLIAGVIGAVIMTAGTWVLYSFTGAVMEEEIRNALAQNPDLPPQVQELVSQITSGGNLMLLWGVVSIPLYAVFSMLGALLGLAIFRKKTPPAPQA